MFRLLPKNAAESILPETFTALEEVVDVGDQSLAIQTVNNMLFQCRKHHSAFPNILQFFVSNREGKVEFYRDFAARDFESIAASIVENPLHPWESKYLRSKLLVERFRRKAWGIMPPESIRNLKYVGEEVQRAWKDPMAAGKNILAPIFEAIVLGSPSDGHHQYLKTDAPGSSNIFKDFPAVVSQMQNNKAWTADAYRIAGIDSFRDFMGWMDGSASGTGITTLYQKLHLKDSGLVAGWKQKISQDLPTELQKVTSQVAVLQNITTDLQLLDVPTGSELDGKKWNLVERLQDMSTYIDELTLETICTSEYMKSRDEELGNAIASWHEAMAPIHPFTVAKDDVDKNLDLILGPEEAAGYFFQPRSGKSVLKAFIDIKDAFMRFYLADVEERKKAEQQAQRRAEPISASAAGARMIHRRRTVAVATGAETEGQPTTGAEVNQPRRPPRALPEYSVGQEVWYKKEKEVVRFKEMGERGMCTVTRHGLDGVDVDMVVSRFDLQSELLSAREQQTNTIITGLRPARDRGSREATSTTATSVTHTVQPGPWGTSLHQRRNTAGALTDTVGREVGSEQSTVGNATASRPPLRPPPSKYQRGEKLLHHQNTDVTFKEMLPGRRCTVFINGDEMTVDLDDLKKAPAPEPEGGGSSFSWHATGRFAPESGDQRGW